MGPPRRQSSRRPERPEVQAAGAGGGITSGLLWRGGRLRLEGEWAPGGSGDGWPPPPRDLDPGLGGRGWSPQSGEEASAGWRRTGPWRPPCLSAGAAPRARTPRDGNRQAHFADGKLRLRSPRSEVRGQRVRRPDPAGQAALCRQRPPIAHCPCPRASRVAARRGLSLLLPRGAAGPTGTSGTWGLRTCTPISWLQPPLCPPTWLPATLPVARDEADPEGGASRLPGPPLAERAHCPPVRLPVRTPSIAGPCSPGETQCL